MPSPADELFELYNRQLDRREVTLPLDFEQAPPGSITTLAIQRAGVGRSYTATFQFAGHAAFVFYTGEGVGLEGKRFGTVKYAPLWNLMCFLAEQGETLADGYLAEVKLSYAPGSLYDAKLLIHRGEQTQCIYCPDCEAPPLVQVAFQLLDLLLDQADWEGKPFTIQRHLPSPDYGR